MIEVDENHGPYIVLAPGVALAHAQPDGSVTHPTMIKAPATAPSDTDEEPSAPGVAPHRRRLDLLLGGIADIRAEHARSHPSHQPEARCLPLWQVHCKVSILGSGRGEAAVATGSPHRGITTVHARAVGDPG